jgi:ubiquinone/menaquinone biosynthesis C-methylase UbiE
MKENNGEIKRSLILKLTRTPTDYQRSKLFNNFIREFGNKGKEKFCLDIGGFSEGFENLAKMYQTIAINMELRQNIEGWNLVIGDGRQLPFIDKSIDIIICNSLLEHVNEGREELIQEIRRVGKGNYFISVPYFFSPFEPHYLLPLFQFVPELKKFLLLRMGLKIGWMNKGNYHKIRLFKKSQLKKLFPEATISISKTFWIPTNLVAFYKVKI